MKIIDVRVHEVCGVMDHTPSLPGGGPGRKRTMPNDIYPGLNQTKGVIGGMPVLEDGKYVLSHKFLEIETDDGIVGRSGPCCNSVVIDQLLHICKPLLMGEDPFHINRLWDAIFRTNPKGYAGEYMIALSHIDIAIWDILTKKMGIPLYKALGGCCQERIPAYANMVGYPSTPDEAVEATGRLVGEEGYTAMKWYPPYGPAEGEAGMLKNVELLQAVREKAGNGITLMVDAWNSWTYEYTMRIAPYLKELDIRFIEEPLMPALFDGYERLSRECCVPIAAGEHIFTRWGFKRFLDADICGYYQPDPEWTGGVSETKRIIDLANCYNKPVILHGSFLPAVLALSVSQPSTVIPMIEWILNISPVEEYFFQKPVMPEHGFFRIPDDTPGAGLELDEKKISRHSYER